MMDPWIDPPRDPHWKMTTIMRKPMELTRKNIATTVIALEQRKTPIRGCVATIMSYCNILCMSHGQYSMCVAVVVVASMDKSVEARALGSDIVSGPV